MDGLFIPQNAARIDDCSALELGAGDALFPGWIEFRPTRTVLKHRDMKWKELEESEGERDDIGSRDEWERRREAAGRSRWKLRVEEGDGRH